MDDLKRIMSNAPKRWKMSYHDLDWELLRSSISLRSRKLSRAFILFIALSLSVIIFVSYSTDQSGVQDAKHHLSSQTQSHVPDGHHEPDVVPDQHQSGTVPIGHNQLEAGLDQHRPDAVPDLHQPDAVNASQHQSDPVQAEDEPSDAKVDLVEKVPKDRRFVLVIPATSPSPDLCKTIVTALALGYPSPVIINWGVDYHAITKWEGGANLPKIPGFVNYLDAAMHPDAHPDERLRDDDLVLMVDAYDVWFQLPAEVFLSRYHEINKKANAGLRQQWHRNEPMPMQQTIIAGSGKNCHPQVSSGSNMHCDILPESPLRADLYGPDTEKNETKHRDHRPRYINGGLYIGPAGDMRRLFRRAMEKMEAGLNQGVHLFSEQGIPGEVLGEQEVWRRWRRENEVTGNDAMALMDRDFEYHFGLDYHQDLSMQTFWTDTDDGLFDGAFVLLNNQTAIDEHSEALGISPVRLKGVPDDVRKARNPLANIMEAPDWGDMPLYADFFTEAVPAIVHHNGFKERRTSWWDKPWFHQHLRQLLASHLAPVDSAAPLVTVETKTDYFRYWAPQAETSHRGPRRMADSAHAPLAKMEFQQVCQHPGENIVTSGKHWWDEVFRDTKGPLR